MKKITFTLLYFILSYQINSQVNEEWVARYDGLWNGMDIARSIAVDLSGNVYVTGNCYMSGTNTDYVTIKYNSSGVQQWLQAYNSPGNKSDHAYSIAVDISGNVYVTGAGNDDYVTVKYNALGVQQWVQRYNGTGNNDDRAYSIAVDVSGNVYVTGYSGDEFAPDYVTIKYNTSGVQQWVQRYNGLAGDIDVATALAIDLFGNVYVTGYSIGYGTGYDYVTIKYNGDGIQQWIQKYSGPGLHDYANAIAVDISGNVYVTGYSPGNGTMEDYATIKYNTDGVQQWVQRYDGPRNHSDYANAITVDISGNVYITGESSGNGTAFDIATIKYNTAGVQQWVQRYNGPANAADRGKSIAVDASGNVYVTGETIESGYSTDYATIKYNTDGVQQWVQRYNGTANTGDNALSVAVDTSGNVYVTGESWGHATGSDYATIKYSQLVGIRTIPSEIIKEFILYQNYPNPFNPNTKIKFDIPSTRNQREKDGQPPDRGFITLKIYDVLGREVATLVNEKLSPGTYEAEWDGSSYAGGVYFYKLVANVSSRSSNENYSQTKKLVLLK